MESVSIVSMNCRGLGDRKKRQDVFNQMKEKQIEVVCLQDIHIDKNSSKKVRAEWGFEAIFSLYSSNARGVAILLNNNFDYKIHKSRSDCDGNFIVLDISIMERRMTLVNLYGPNEDKPIFYNQLKDIIDSFENNSVIICGDWNMVINPEIDSYNYKNVNNPKAREEVLKLMEEMELVDIWRIAHTDKRHYTWSKKNPVKMARLDFFLCSEDFLNIVDKVEICPKYRSDHSPIKLVLTVSQHKKGNGYWKLNNSLLKDSNFVQMIKEVIYNTKVQYAASPYNHEYLATCSNENLQLKISDQLFFDTLLLNLRGKIIAYSSKKKRENLKREQELEKEIKQLDEEIKEDPRRYNLRIDTLEKMELELENFRKTKIEGYIIRSRAKWYESGEKSSKFFCNLENKNFTNKVIQKLELDNGVIVRDSDDILNAQTNFYKKLYENHDTVDDEDLNIILQKYVSEDSIPKLSKDDKEKKEGLITYRELLAALKNTKNNKSPGIDGFTTEFYKFFWRDICYFLLRSINQGYERGQLSISQQQGLITCIPKQNKPREFLKNWRPITLLNVSYKLASSCIANRIKSSLDHLIHENQKGFIKGRFIGENTRLIYDIMYETEKNNIPGLLMMIDFEKAFDTLSWKFIEKILDSFNFGESVRKWIYLFYNNARAAVIQNGKFSEFFPLGRGCRQGDPLSPYIFILCVEVLGIAIRDNPYIKGIRIGDTEHKITQFADDTNLFLDDDEESLKHVVATLDWFYSISGLKANVDKTKLIRIGSIRESDRRFCRENNFEWVTGNFTILGITYNIDMKNLIEINLNPKMLKMNNILKIWKMRNLTPIGKISIIKTMVLPIITHILTSLPDPPDELINRIENMFYEFIWNNKRNKIKKTTLVKTIEDGGLKMIDLRNYIKSLKISWLKRFMNNNVAWECFIRPVTKDMICSVGSKLLKTESNNPFWQGVFEAWDAFSSRLRIDSSEDILSQPLWGNPHFKLESIQPWMKKGIFLIADICDDQGVFLTTEVLKNRYRVKGTYLDVCRIVKSIPYRWKEKIFKSRHIGPFIMPALKLLLSKKKGCKHFAEVLNATPENQRLKSQYKWMEDLKTHDIDWKYCYSLPYVCTTDTSLRYFQYKILHRLITTNRFLKLIGVNSDEYCTFCGRETESIVHLFADCEYVSPVWEALTSWLRKCGYSQLDNISSIDIICGIRNVDPIVNLCILLSKYVIYRCKLQEKAPSFAAVKAYIRYISEIEKYIAKTDIKEQKYLGKWSSLLNNL